MNKIKMDGVREHNEGMDIELTITDGKLDADKPEKDVQPHQHMPSM